MNLRQLECFVAVAEEGSFTRAAERVGIAQPSLSQHIRAWSGPLELVGWEEFVVVVAETDPLGRRSTVRLEELAGREWVLYHPDHGLAGVLDNVCRRAGFVPHGSVRTAQAEGAAR